MQSRQPCFFLLCVCVCSHTFPFPRRTRSALVEVCPSFSSHCLCWKIHFFVSIFVHVCIYTYKNTPFVLFHEFSDCQRCSRMIYSVVMKHFCKNVYRTAFHICLQRFICLYIKIFNEISSCRTCLMQSGTYFRCSLLLLTQMI